MGFSFDSSKAGWRAVCFLPDFPGPKTAAGDGCSRHIPARAPIAGLGTLEEVPPGEIFGSETPDWTPGSHACLKSTTEKWSPFRNIAKGMLYMYMNIFMCGFSL